MISFVKPIADAADRWLHGGLVGGMLLTAASGVWWIESHTLRSSQTATVVSQWPVHSQLARRVDSYHGVLFVHPHCPCSRNSLEILERHLQHSPIVQQWQVVFVVPAGVSQAWWEGRSWQRAGQIDGLQRVLDFAGEEARRFSATNSGHCFIFDPAGRLVFDGGLTAGRGRVGLSLGQKFLQSMGGGLTVETTKAPVYGCTLQEPGA